MEKKPCSVGGVGRTRELVGLGATGKPGRVVVLDDQASRRRAADDRDRPVNVAPPEIVGC